MSFHFIQSVLESTPRLRYVVDLAQRRLPHQPIRHLHATTPLLVKRQQEPYEYTVPKVDGWGLPVKAHAEGDPQSVPVDVNPTEQEEFLAELRHSGRRTWTEKYGSLDGFGLRNKTRYFKSPNGTLIRWEAAGQNWKEATGYHQRRVETELPRAKLEARREFNDNLIASMSDDDLAHGITQAEENVEALTEVTPLQIGDWQDPQGVQGRRQSFFVKRKRAASLRKEKKKLELMNKEIARRDKIKVERRKADQEFGGDSLWEVEAWNEDEGKVNREAMGNIPPSQRKALDERIEAQPTFGVSDQAHTDTRVGWGQRSTRNTIPGPRIFGSRYYSTTTRSRLPSRDPQYQFTHQNVTSASRRISTPRSTSYRSAAVWPSSLRQAQQQQQSSTTQQNSNSQMPSLSRTTEEQGISDSPSAYTKRRWEPTKKLTYSAMEGLRELHRNDPVQFDRATLAKQFRISFEAVSRILKSNWRNRRTKPSLEAKPSTSRPKPEVSLTGTKWDVNPETSDELSPVPKIREAFQARERAHRSARDIEE